MPTAGAGEGEQGLSLETQLTTARGVTALKFEGARKKKRSAHSRTRQ